MSGRCQICNRRKGLRKGGGVVFHHVDGAPCAGAGFPPIEISNDRLEAYVQELEARHRAIAAEIKALEDARANYIDPLLIELRTIVWRRLYKLERRRDRIRSWPERFERLSARQMLEQGFTWTPRPPDYLLKGPQA